MSASLTLAKATKDECICALMDVGTDYLPIICAMQTMAKQPDGHTPSGFLMPK
ncbi:hypothetical protein [Polynucleobacter ibericus]|uniref:hypothetical protein n=1 Tax=Polynucleobacter ibericus TaxID=1819725 RepID=UPI001BFD4065|nr:hypothetical protein [Polynucleobacter ibericus]QWE09283.1 hypothetical protein AOC20_03475 [Polynucleobacter ibericus]